MSNKYEVLNCAECPLSVGGEICANVAMETVRQLGRLGYDTSSDMRSAQEIVTVLAKNDPEVQATRRLECTLRLAKLASTQSGYVPVVY